MSVMLEKIFLYVLILVGIVSQGSVGTFLDDDVRESSSDLLERKKRVINQIPGQSDPVPIARVPYVVNILQGTENHCVGSILSHRTVITAEICVPLAESAYKVHAGSVFTTTYGSDHDVVGKKVHAHDRAISGGIALIFIHPPFIYGRDTGYLNLHTGPVESGMTGTVSGWGVDFARASGTRFPGKLRSIHPPIIPTPDCIHSYRGLFNVTQTDICTFDVRQFSGHTDIGASLVINNHVAGILIWRQKIRGHKKPDVFLSIQHADYSHWITTNVV